MFFLWPSMLVEYSLIRLLYEIPGQIQPLLKSVANECVIHGLSSVKYTVFCCELQGS